VSAVGVVSGPGRSWVGDRGVKSRGWYKEGCDAARSEIPGKSEMEPHASLSSQVGRSESTRKAYVVSRSTLRKEAICLGRRYLFEGKNLPCRGIGVS
jgi:hypothetical protein